MSRTICIILNTKRIVNTKSSGGFIKHIQCIFLEKVGLENADNTADFSSKQKYI
jgi:hypothetical protein